MSPQIVMSGTRPTLYFAIGDVWYTSRRVRGETAPPIAGPMYMTVATAVTARVYVVYPGTMLEMYAYRNPPRVRKMTWALTGEWGRGVTGPPALGRRPAFDIATA